jgi:hypothetical protein
MESQESLSSSLQRKKRKKLKLRKYHFKDAGSEIHSIGLCRQNINEEIGENESKSHRNLRVFLFVIMNIILLKHISLLLFYHYNRMEEINDRVFLWFGDFFHSHPQMNKQFIVGEMIAVIRLLQTQILYHYLWQTKKMKCIASSSLFQVFSGFKSSKELCLRSKDVIKLMRM